MMEKALRSIKKGFQEFISQFDPADDTKEMYEEVKQGNPQAMKKMQKRSYQANLLSKGRNIKPYVAISAGKQSNKLGVISGFVTIMTTTSGIYLTLGHDRTADVKSGIASYSISFGIISGNHSGLPGWGVGDGTGGLLGIERGHSLNVDLPNSISFGSTGNVGMTFSTTPLYISGNVGYTWQLVSFDDNK